MSIIGIVNNPVDTEDALIKLCKYITNSKGAGMYKYIGGRGLYPETAYDDMCESQRMFGKIGGRRAYHLFVSFREGTPLIPDEALEMAYEISDFFYPRHQVLFGVHTEQSCLHIHFAVSTVSLDGGPKLHLDFKMQHEFKRFVSEIEKKYDC